MSASCDDPDEMRRDHGLDERTTEDILRGRTTALDGTHRELAETIAVLRAQAIERPQPNDELLHMFAGGIDVPDALAAPAAASETTVASGRLGHGRLILRKRLARLAGIGLVAKIALAGTAVAATAVGGAGAAGILPGQGDDPPPAEPAEEAEADFGQDTADDATEDSVDGQDIADEARQLRDAAADASRDDRSGQTEQEPREKGVGADETGPDEADEPGAEEARERTAEAPDPVPQSGNDGRRQADERTEDPPVEEHDSEAAVTDPSSNGDSGQQQRETDGGAKAQADRQDDEHDRDAGKPDTP